MVEVPVLSLLWLRSLLWCRFDPRKLCMPLAWLKRKERKKKKKKNEGPILTKNEKDKRKPI